MDWLKNKEQLHSAFKKYRIYLLVLAAGLILMGFPEKDPSPVSQQEAIVTEPDIARELEEILSQVKGAGKVAVLLTEKTGEEMLYQMDKEVSEGSSSGTLQTRTVMTTTNDRTETGLVRQVNPPKYLGAVIVCQGGDDPQVKLSIVEAVMRATGLPSSSISVLKMK